VRRWFWEQIVQQQQVVQNECDRLYLVVITDSSCDYIVGCKREREKLRATLFGNITHLSCYGHIKMSSSFLVTLLTHVRIHLLLLSLFSRREFLSTTMRLSHSQVVIGQSYSFSSFCAIQY
jgi:hypothetical protein